MNKKLLQILQDKCKDFGLSEKAIEDLAKSKSEGIKEDASDEDIQEIADSLVPFARLMQAEVTRKAQKKEPKPTETSKEDKEDEGNKGSDQDEPAWFKAYKAEQEKKLQSLQDENAAMKADKAKGERGAQIAAKAKELGIPEVLMKHVSIADDADIDTELSQIKQDLVTQKLMPSEPDSIISSSDKAAKDEAENWAKSLPDNN